MGLFGKEETASCCCGGNCTPQTMPQQVRVMLNFYQSFRALTNIFYT